MDEKKSILILTDDADVTKTMAGVIGMALRDYKVKQTDASNFRGNDLLEAEVVFLGCERPNPPSFEYIAKLFRHINLAGRSCGIFTSGTITSINYLTGLLRDSEIGIFEPPLTTKDAQKILTWARFIIDD